MNRLHKKCLIASSGLHGFLLLLVLFGSAFFVAKERQINNPKLRFVPSRFVEEALAGGGGNPKIAQTDDVQKGSPQAPAQVAPAPPAPPPPAPKPEVKKTEPKKPDAPAPTPKPVKPVDVAKTPEKTPPTKPRIDPSDLKPIARTDTDKRKAQQEAEAQEAARQRALATAVANAANAQRQKIAQQIGKATETMQRGFQSGTKVDVGGPGGEAYANYAALVQAAYEDAWQIIQDLSDDDSVALVRVTIARDGRILSARIIERANNSSMNKSVQRALDAVKKLPPFPDFIKDAERSFTIEFNLKAKRLPG